MQVKQELLGGTARVLLLLDQWLVEDTRIADPGTRADSVPIDTVQAKARRGVWEDTGAWAEVILSLPIKTTKHEMNYLAECRSVSSRQDMVALHLHMVGSRAGTAVIIQSRRARNMMTDN